MSEKGIKFIDKALNTYNSQYYLLHGKTIAPANHPNPEIPNGFIISAWSPNTETLTLEENKKQGWELFKALKKTETLFTKIVTVEATRAWVEDSFLITGITQTQAKALATQFGQLAFVELNAGIATIYDIKRETTTEVFLDYQPTKFGCPAKENGLENNEHCKQHGYFSTGSAISALKDWRDNLTIVISRLGCSFCQNVSAHPSPLVQIRDQALNIKVTNRYSIAQWVRR